MLRHHHFAFPNLPRPRPHSVTFVSRRLHSAVGPAPNLCDRAKRDCRVGVARIQALHPNQPVASPGPHASQPRTEPGDLIKAEMAGASRDLMRQKLDDILAAADMDTITEKMVLAELKKTFPAADKPFVKVCGNRHYPLPGHCGLKYLTCEVLLA